MLGKVWRALTRIWKKVLKTLKVSLFNLLSDLSILENYPKSCWTCYITEHIHKFSYHLCLTKQAAYFIMVMYKLFRGWYVAWSNKFFSFQFFKSDKLQRKFEINLLSIIKLGKVIGQLLMWQSADPYVTEAWVLLKSGNWLAS